MITPYEDHGPVRARPASADDPVLTPDAMCADAGISRATWNRNWRHRLPIVRVSARRIGCRRSAWRAALEQGSG